MLTWVIDASLRHRGWVLLIACALAAVGVVALQRIDIDAFPDTTSVQVQVNTTSPALAAEEVERQITFPLERREWQHS